MEKVAIFIDGSNFYYGLKSIGHKNFDISEFDFQKLGKILCGKRELVRIYYYNAPLNIEEDQEKYKKQQRFFERLKNIPNFSLILCRMQKRKIGGQTIYVVKGDDIHIAVDMVKLAYNNAYDTAILVSGDGDFVPAVKAIQDRGKKVEHAYFRIGHSWFLRQTCDKCILMDSKLIEKCL